MREDVKLGTLIDGHAFRDAVHIAVVPMIAAERLKPGQHVGIISAGRIAGGAIAKIGVVDPFLKRVLEAGQKCYLCLFPGTITTLRHQWEHPAFPAVESVARDPEGEHRRVIEGYA
jgi:hypothetical protein